MLSSRLWLLDRLVQSEDRVALFPVKMVDSKMVGKTHQELDLETMIAPALNTYRIVIILSEWLKITIVWRLLFSRKLKFLINFLYVCVRNIQTLFTAPSHISANCKFLYHMYVYLYFAYKYKSSILILMHVFAVAFDDI